MHHLRLSTASFLAHALFTSPFAFTSPTPASTHLLHRRGELIYRALGDSYAAGPGAGEAMTHTSLCQQYTESYPSVLNRILNKGDNITPEAHQACAGATAKDIIKYQPMDPLASMATISFGLEHINFTNVINDCVYTFKDRGIGTDCNTTLQWTMHNLEAQFTFKVREVIENALEGDRVPEFQLFLVGFARFWNAETDYCDQVSWEFWEFGGGQLMTKDRRQKMNDWIIKVNDIMNNVVTNFRKNGETRVHFINYDHAFNGHRFCEEKVVEPQRDDESRPEAYLFQYRTSRNQRWGTNSMAPAVGPAVDWMSWIADTHKKEFGLKISKYYATQPVSLDGGDGAAVPISMSKIFHPTPAGHAAIAAAIEFAIPAALNEAIEAAARAPDQPSAPTSLGRPNGLVEQEATCGEELSLNFPKFFVLQDGRLSAAQILQRIRDQACRGVCDAVPGITGNLIRWRKNSETGCEYAVKIGPKWELYFFASEAGDNCVEASTIMIEQCMTEKDPKVRLRNSGSLDGPNDGESYKIGVRPMNGLGSNHAAFPDNTDHLPYRQLSCKIDRGTVTFHYFIQLYLWDDNERGQSIRRMIKEKVYIGAHHFRWMKSEHFFFDDHTYSEFVYTFRIGVKTEIMPEAGLDDFFQLEKGSFRCQVMEYRDIPIWLDDDYDITSNKADGADALANQYK